MPLPIYLLGVLSPRIAVAVLWTTGFFASLFSTLLLPVCGALLVPLTLITYTWLIRTHRQHDGVFVTIIVVAVILDLTLVGGLPRSSAERRLPFPRAVRK